MWKNYSVNLRGEINLANFLTLLNGLAEFLSILFILDGDFDTPPKLILVAVLLDGLDGRVARFLDRSGEMGRELDSLADIVSFGVAPALLIYQSKLLVEGHLGAVAASSVVIAGIIRLARFNVIKTGEHFLGLPIPATGFFLTLYATLDLTSPLAFTGGVIALSLLMVSNVKYPSLKTRRSLGTEGLTLGICSLVLLIALTATTTYPIFKTLILAPIIAYIALGPLTHRIFRKT